MDPTRRLALLALGLLVAGGVRAAAQRPAPTPPAPSRPSGGFSPFRQKGFAGTSFGGASLEQPGCPLVVSVTGLTRADRGVVLAIQVNNMGETNVTEQVLGLWVLAPDGTVRGYQKWNGERPIEPAKYRSVDVIVRATVMPDDVVVVAVQEALGGSAPWRRSARDLEREIREAMETRP